MIIADRVNSRLHIYNTIPTTSNAASDIQITGLTTALESVFALGTSLYIGNHITAAGIQVQTPIPTVTGAFAPTATIVGGASGCSLTDGISFRDFMSDGTKLYANDLNNGRLMVWNTVPTTAAAANFVIGKATDTGCLTGTTANIMWASGGSVIVGTKLVVSDLGNNRVLIYNTIPTATNAAASVVLGQPTMIVKVANNGGISASTLNSPQGVASDGTRLFVADTSNNRILIWNTVPTVDQTAADFVLGQGDFVHMTANDNNQDNLADAGPTARTLSAPVDVFYYNGYLWVNDVGNNRILRFNP